MLNRSNPSDRLAALRPPAVRHIRGGPLVAGVIAIVIWSFAVKGFIDYFDPPADTCAIDANGSPALFNGTMPALR